MEKQLELTEMLEKKQVEKLNNSNIIKNISYDQTEILHNIGVLYNNGSDQFDADMTASSLGFYGKSSGCEYNIPAPKILMDVCPTRNDIIKIEKWGSLPLENESIHSLVIDLPFIVSPQNAPSVKAKKEGANIIFNRFSSYYPVDNLYLSYYHWLSEASRVLEENGICIFKCQSVISGVLGTTLKSSVSWPHSDLALKWLTSLPYLQKQD